MTIKHPRQELLALVEGRLDQAGQVRLERHLAGCPRCRSEAAELMELTDSLSALPGALRGLSERQAGSWPAVWARVRGLPIRRMVPQLNLYLSLAAIVFVLAAAVPAGLGAQPLSVTAGVIQTPMTPATPIAGTAAVSAGRVSTALAAGRLARGARAIPNPTPVPGQRG